jgi:protocatechuate 3,4-dioxygenase beta subunit
MRSDVLLGLLAATAGALAQQTASVTGQVTNSVTGEPIVRAHVTLRGKQNFGALTNGEGKFSITGILPGGYAYAAERVGFTTAHHFGTLVEDLRAGENSLNLKLIPMGSVSGRVLDADGEPVQLAEVVAVGADNDFSAGTDKHGKYRIGGLAPGKYRVVVRPEGGPEEIHTDGSKQVHYRSTYYPGVATSTQAARISVPAGGELTGVDIRLLTMAIVRVSGKILDIPAGWNATVEFRSERTANSSEGFPVRAASDGSFVSPCEPGKYTLRAESGEGEAALHAAPVEVELGTTNVDNLELRLIPSFNISGHVEYEDDRAREAAKPPVENLRGTLLKDRTIVISPGEAEIGADDSFSVERVQPGRYRVSIILGHTFVKSVSLGSVPSDGWLDVRNGSGGAPLTVVVSAAWGEISGTVSDSNGPVGGVVVLRTEVGGSSVVDADSQGRYTIKNVRPGTYKLIAGDGRLSDRSDDPDLLDDYKDGVVTLEVHAGDKITRDLKQILPDK